jgi:molybdenum cofactor biosynthesis enzyme MoaA
MFDLLKDGLTQIITDLSAGTAETFKKIKGVDCFDKVLGNLGQYASSGGNVSVKYILFKGINDNIEEIEKFIDIAVRLKVSVLLSKNFVTIKTSIEQEQLDVFVKFIHSLKVRNVKFSLAEETFRSEDVRYLRRYGALP